MRLSARSWKATDLDKNESSPRPAVRDGMEQEPFGSRVRAREAGGKALRVPVAPSANGITGWGVGPDRVGSARIDVRL